MDANKIFSEAKAPGLTIPQRLTKYEIVIREFNAAFVEAGIAADYSVRATLCHNIGAAYFQCALLNASPELILPSAALQSTDEMLYQWKAFNEWMGRKACILYDAADTVAVSQTLDKWRTRVEEGMLSMKKTVEISWRKRMLLLQHMAEAVGAVTGVAGVGGIRAVTVDSAKFSREHLAKHPFSPGVAAYNIAADAAQEFAYMASIDATSTEPVTLHAGAASSVVSSKTGGGHYRSALPLLSEAKRLTEIAIIFSKKDGTLLYSANKLSRDIFRQQCLFSSQQALEEADGLLRGHLGSEESLEGLNMDLCWIVLDVYKRAILEARDQDIESEAIAMSRMGKLYGSVFKLAAKAHQCYYRSIQLAISLQPMTFTKASWYIEAENKTREYQLLVVAKEVEEEDLQFAGIKTALAIELAALEAADKESIIALLKHIYSKHPPKCVTHVLGDVDALSLQKTLLHANMHYSPDEAPMPDAIEGLATPEELAVRTEALKWRYLCLQISKLVNAAYELRKYPAKPVAPVVG